MSFLIWLRVLKRLGLPNVIRIGLYRFGVQFGFHKVLSLRRKISGTSFYSLPNEMRAGVIPGENWIDCSIYFGKHKFELNGGFPSWNFNQFTNYEFDQKHLPWWQISDFNSRVGDIKAIWEPSRFDWVLSMAQRGAVGEESEVVRLNAWLKDWANHNPPFWGINWKCGQEASIRTMHLALAARILGQDSRPTPDLIQLIEIHLARIHPTLSYAIAQDNNHGTSEAAALFIGGAICERAGVQQGAQWSCDGRKWLENRAQRLVAADGSFCQHSLNYHRVLLDTLSMVELWRRWYSLPVFSEDFLKCARAATTWMYNLIDPETGDGPNVGANDGANLLPLTSADYRDFRPSVQLSMALFCDLKAYSMEGHHTNILDWLEVPLPVEVALPVRSVLFPDGGYSILRDGPLVTLLKYPMYKFRPGHCDALHLDIWYKSRNIMHDSGTYSYNTENSLQDYFPSTAAHNTVEFDDRDQMPTVGRFLRGAWLSATKVYFNAEAKKASAGYMDFAGARHVRMVQLDENRVTVEDDVSGFKSHAILRWRLDPGQWTEDGTSIYGTDVALNISANVDIIRIEIVEGWESLYYLEKTKIPVVEIEVQEPGIITTVISLGVN